MYQAQGWGIARLTGPRAQPNSWPANQEAEETPVSAELSRNHPVAALTCLQVFSKYRDSALYLVPFSLEPSSQPGFPGEFLLIAEDFDSSQEPSWVVQAGVGPLPDTTP
ncbi:hypothetical protein J1605_000004 [Eschrichtius robustus]|uniref:Uncharacterized protein n=1 Tax=Eschrichtius robustus TaxID=9764 RepID=A0AB34I628_ESCRO|nr:hypothetical protein J1605_000004 [Eschrichtius robustus]